MAKRSKKNEEPAANAAVQEPQDAPTAAQDAQTDEQSAQTNGEPESYTLTADEFKRAQAHIAQLQKERDDTVALLQRNQADFDNYRRRNASVRADSYEEGKRDAIAKLLPILDNFDRAMENGAADAGSWRDGIRLVHKQLYDELSKLGLTEVDAAGKFDPNLHNAVMQEKTDDAESGQIVAVFQKGYKVGDRIIRHSMVKVAE